MTASLITLGRGPPVRRRHYYNDGDWVESCTALVEHADGRMEIIDWAQRVAARRAVSEVELV